MRDCMDRPLISYLVLPYNQSPYIREAMESAFSQTYSPLEIIVADDCSKDSTFDIVRQMTDAYHGPHRVGLNRNLTTLGIGGNVNQAMERCRGELVVVAAGDDVSLPHRTEIIYQAWEQSGRQATSIFSSYTAISEDGSFLGIGGVRGDPIDSRPLRTLEGGLLDFLVTRKPVVNGCTHAWSPKLFHYFGPLQSDLEDQVLSFRTLAIGRMLYIHQPLVKYRRHGKNVSFFAEKDDTQSFEHREERLRWVDEKTAMAFDNMLHDIDLLFTKGRVTSDVRDRLRAEAIKTKDFYVAERQMMNGEILMRLKFLARTAIHGDLRQALRFAPRALPMTIFRALYQIRQHWRLS